MFATCYAGNNSPSNTEDKSHCNPIYIRLGGRKNQQKKEKVTPKQDEPSQIKQSIINGCEFLSQPQTQREHPRNVHLIQSVIMPSVCAETNYQQTARVLQENNQQQFFSNRKQPLQSMDAKYNQLQAKYIGALERTNKFLEKQLQRSRAYSQVESKCRSTKKISSELIDLKQRLNNIDFSNLKKLAGEGKSSRITPSQDKENFPTTFKQLRSRLQ